MALLALLALIASIWFVIAGTWYFSPVFYLVGGVIWVLHERRRLFIYWPIGYGSPGGTALVVVIWPLRALNNLIETWKIRSGGERYTFSNETDFFKFARLKDALEAARQEAKTSQQRVQVIDEAKFAKQFGRMQHKTWFVEPDGRVHSLPRSFL